MLRDDPRLGDAWLLAITVAAKGRMADSVLNAGADDYLHRPFTRAELIARTRAGLRAAQQRANDRLLRTLMENVPGAIYRSRLARRLPAGDDHRRDRADLRLPAGELPRRRSRRTILSLVHPDDVDMVLETVAHWPARTPRSRSSSSTGSCRDDGEVRWVLDRGQPVRGPGGRLWLDGAMFDITERRAAEEALLAPRGRGRAHGRAARLPRRASSRPPTRRGARSSATCTTARSSGSSPRARRPGRQAPAGQGPVRRRAVPRPARHASSRTRPPSCASSPAASTRRC